jgi:hypothetical protein
MADPTKSLDPEGPIDDPPDDSPDDGSEATTGASMGDRPELPQDDPDITDDFGLGEDGA